MAIEYIPNQPVFFGDQEDSCFSEANNYSQLVNLGDITQFQLELGVCYNAVNSIPNNSFATSDGWITTGDWTFSGGKATHAPTGISFLQRACLTSGAYYSFTVTVSDTTQGYINVVSFNISNQGTLNYQINSNGTYTFYGYAGSAERFTIKTSADFDGAIDDVFAYELDLSLIIAIYNNQNEFQAKITMADNPDYFTIDNGTVTVLIDWETIGITDFGCYYIGVIDPCFNVGSQFGILNGGFESTNYWTTGAGWVIASNKARFSAGASTSLLTYTGSNFITGKSYQVTYTMADTSPDVNITAKIGANAGSTWGSYGTHSDIIVADGGALVFSANTTTGGYVDLDNIIVELVNDEDLIPTIQSNTFSIGNHTCSLVINACNDEDGLGFKFEVSGFSPLIRLNAALLNPTYPFDRKTQFESTGKAKVNYFKRRKIKKLYIETVPEYVHDFLSLLAGFDRFYIDSVAYFVDSNEYQILTNPDEPNMGGVVIEVSVKTQNIKNLNIGNIESNCAIGENLWIDESGNFIMDGSDGGLIIIN